MNIVERVKNILLKPAAEWDVIAAEATPQKTLILAYVLPLAAFAALMRFVSLSIIGTHGMFGAVYHMPIMWGLVMAVYHLIMAVIAVFVIGFIIDALAPTFGGQKNLDQAVKVAAYSFTAGWVGSVFGIIPWLGWLLAFLMALYGLYILYLGLPRLMKNPADKSIGYTALVVVASIVVLVIISVVGGLFSGAAMLAGGGMAGMGMDSRAAPSVTYDPGSPMGKLNDFTKRMEEQNKKMEAAQKSGDQKAQMEAAMGTLGTVLSGGKGVDPVQTDALKPFVPGMFAGLPQTSTQSERGGVQGLMTAKVEARYGDSSGKNARLEVIDTGGAAGLLGFASWMGIQGEREDANRREATHKDGNRLVHEEMSKSGGSNKYSVVLNDRFVVSASGNVDFGSLKSSVNSLDLGKIEGLK